ncbi:MAG TPA: RNA 2',3'-cyclic phosphodiesterase [Caulobacteraceae bacterium]|jgi:2'-5' RNA ligase|nr:RNA 2',3'-cyclic phosphodiesterase [Caulobacteraceae bacterium]
MIRLFAALGLPPGIAAPLAARQNGIPGARWRPPESLHITLRFFGEIAEDVAADLDMELGAISAAAIDLSLSGAGCFGEGRDIDAVWAGVAENPGLNRLARACEAAARRAGLKPETRRYHPHVTLAYLRRADPLAVAGWIQNHNLLRSPVVRAESFGLYSSHMGREGSRYHLERVYRLEKAGDGRTTGESSV